MTSTSGQVDAGARARVDGDALLSQLDIDAAEIDRRKSFVRLSAADERRLRDLEPLLDEFADEFAASFYDHLGFEIQRRITDYYEDGGDAYYLRLGDDTSLREKFAEYFRRSVVGE